MTQPQILAVGILCALMVLFIWDRLRYDVVAVMGLLASIIAGTVPMEKAFTGFSDDIVIIVGSALIVSAAIGRSGIIEDGLARLTARITRMRWQLMVLVSSVTVLSALVKNIGALAMLMPAALKMAKRSGASPSAFLMPMSFGALLGGLVTMIGTSPNIIVSRVREQMTGEPFGMFDYTPVGAALAVAGIIFLRFAYRLLPRDRRALAKLDEALHVGDYTTEATVAPNTAAAGQIATHVAEKTDDVEVTAVLRGPERRAVPPDFAVLTEGDTVVLKGQPDALEQAITAGGMKLEGQHRATVTDSAPHDLGVVEAVVTSRSRFNGMTVGALELHDRYGLNLLAISRAGERLAGGIRDTRLRAGDVVVLQGVSATLPEQLRELGCLPLVERRLRLAGTPRGLISIAILLGAMVLTAVGAVPVTVAFFGAAVLVIVSGGLPAREAYENVDWPILIMIGALIPVSGALQTTGVTDLIAHALSQFAVSLPAWGAVALILIAAMAVTPFLNNAATVLVMAPIGAKLAQDLQLTPDAFLMAVAIGAGCDFLTPIGHQCNTLVMGPGGYKFKDYARLGAPLSLLVVALSVPLLMYIWPVR
jgi:di/tricarboxylate transporter